MRICKGVWPGGLLSAFAIIALFCIPASGGDVGRANRDLMFAKDNAESGRWDDLDTNMKKAATDMQGLSDAEKAPLLASIAQIKATVTKSIEDEVNKRLDNAAKADPGSAKSYIDRAAARLNSDEAKTYADPAAMDKLRARIAGMTGAPAPKPTPSTPAKTAANAPSGAMSDELAGAAAKARSARNLFEQASGVADYNMAESFMHDAQKRLDAINDPAKATFVADMTALAKQIDDAQLKAQRHEEFQRADSQVHRYLQDAESGIQSGVVGYPDRIDKAAELIASDEIRMYVDTNQLQEYVARLDAIRAKFNANNKAAALERSAPIIKDLETELAADPFKGTDERSAYDVFTKLKTLSNRASHEFSRVRHDDPQIKAALERLTAADAKLEASAGKRALEQAEAQFAASWQFASQNFTGWQAEHLDPAAAAARHVAGLDKTIQAVSGTVYWLNNVDTKQTTAKHKADSSIVATAQAAQKTLDETSAKLNEAFNAVIAQAEQNPMPARDVDRADMSNLTHDAGHWFAGTKYKEANVARANALDTKWKAEMAREEKEMAQTLKKLTDEANAAWPKIEASVSAERGFTPSDLSQWKGKTIEIKGYYNRSGWDFDGAWDYAVDIKGTPVAGKYEPNVREAFNGGSRHTKFGIDDHVGWDIIAVVVGKGEIKRRTRTDWRDKETHEVILKTETYVPEPCVVLKIIGLRAGPVAVGPN